MLALAAIVRCRPSTREGCGEPLPLAGQRRVGRTQVVELPPVRPVVVEAWQYAARCEGCGHRTTGTYPAGQWVFRTTAASYHGIVPRRNADAIAAFLGDARPEDGVSDLRSPQLGADVSAIFTSLRTTARKRGENLFQALRSVAGPSPLHAAGVPTRADTNCSHNVSIA